MAKIALGYIRRAINFTPEQLEAIKKIAKEQRKTESEVIRTLLDKALKEK